MPDNLTPEQRRRCMSAVRNRDTEPERLLRSALHRRGFRFRKHLRDLPGSPDVVFTKARVAVFVDGAFWHGRGFGSWRDDVAPFWRQKIAANRQRDLQCTLALRQAGWRVIRIWDREVASDLDRCVRRIALVLGRASGCMPEEAESRTG